LKKLNEILYRTGIKVLVGSTDVEIQSVCFDSRQVKPGSLFVAVKGTTSDGHLFIGQAIHNGAIAIVCEDIPTEKVTDITYVKVLSSGYALGVIASNFYDSPSSKLKLIGITGTNGKTTFVTLLFNLFRQLGYHVGMLSTVKNMIDDEEIAATHTTPDAITLNLMLRKMCDRGVTHCFIEVSSHAIVQNRIAGLEFAGGVFSNITLDHLDFHKTFDEYIKAKKAFFDGLPSQAFALTNVDDKNGLVMLQNTKAEKKTYALKNLADFKCKIIENQFAGLKLNVDGEEVWSRLVGEFNAYNLLAVYSTAVLLGEDKIKVLTILSNLESAEGRFDYFISSDGIIAIVDYAHTPDALKNVLTTIGNIRSGDEQLITVVGCGGDRDHSKRPIMAAIACKLSDRIIITSDNPRSEEPEAIINDMKKGIEPQFSRKVLSIIDRREAIKTACALAKPKDIILVAGKGHEKYQDSKGEKHHFDDKEILREILLNK